AVNGISDPNRIYVGQRLRLRGKPAATAPGPKAKARDALHIVAWGETLTSIAHHYGSTIAAIVRANGIANPSYLRVGQRLTIPGAGGTTAVVAARVSGMSAGMASLVAARDGI